jgi:hypothetical protein
MTMNLQLSVNLPSSSPAMDESFNLRPIPVRGLAVNRSPTQLDESTCYQTGDSLPISTSYRTFGSTVDASTDFNWMLATCQTGLQPSTLIFGPSPDEPAMNFGLRLNVATRVQPVIRIRFQSLSIFCEPLINRRLLLEALYPARRRLTFSLYLQ